MKKIILTFLITLVVISTYGQITKTERISQDGRLHVISHIEGETQVSTYLEIFENGKLIKKIDTEKLQLQSKYPAYPFYGALFRTDNKKIYIKSATLCYIYDLEKDKLTQLFKNQNINVMGIDDDDNGLICCPYIVRGNYYKRKAELYNLTKEGYYYSNDNIFKYIDGKSYPINGPVYLNKKEKRVLLIKSNVYCNH